MKHSQMQIEDCFWSPVISKMCNEIIPYQYEVLNDEIEGIPSSHAIENFRIASGQKLSYTQEDIRLTGHAIECRINAENPEKGFRPSPGTITDMYLPGGKGIRIDSAIYSGYTIPPYYDSMVAKLIVWAKNRQEAIRKMQSALGEVIIEGIDTNVDYQYGIVNHPDYIEGNIDIEFIERL